MPSKPGKLSEKAELFLRAILASPEDDTPRLVYADWLEEQGSPRGEFIRIQCELARRGTDRGRKRALEARERELLEQYGDGWREPYWPFPFLTSREFFRGFVKGASIDLGDFVSRPSQAKLENALLQLGPAEIRLYGLEEGGRRSVRKLAESRILSMVTALKIIDANEEIVETLVGSPYIENLRRMGIRRGSLGNGGARAIANASRLSHLTALRLNDCGLSNDEALVLLTSPHLERLVELDLSENLYVVGSVNDDVAQAARSQSGPAHLASLNLNYTNVEDEFVELLVTLPALSKLTKLSLGADWNEFWGMSDEGVNAIAGSAILSGLSSLGLGCNEITDRGVEALLNSPNLGTLAELDLRNTRIGLAGVIAIASSPRMSSLRSLSLSPVEKLGDNYAEVLASSPVLAGLKELCIEWCGIGDKGARAIAVSPYLKNLEVLNLSNNQIGYSGAKQLATASSLANIEKLYLSNNKFGERSKELLKSCFGDRLSEEVISIDL